MNKAAQVTASLCTALRSLDALDARSVDHRGATEALEFIQNARAGLERRKTSGPIEARRGLLGVGPPGNILPGPRWRWCRPWGCRRVAPLIYADLASGRGPGVENYSGRIHLTTTVVMGGFRANRV